ncbi:MAG TPA: intradiol ring-cleavage dioxygenase, partial [Verrucomicrobiae bacterium]|nr:intradiol ring-cleavage dioxygenase [Verrucomicrobiae bacterium]
SPVPFQQLSYSDTLPDYRSKGQKLHLMGVVYQNDGRTPAPGVVLYIYHTDQTGVYPTRGGEKGWDKRHGYLRGWIKTNQQGQYAFYTLKPVGYNHGKAPAHIHITVKEPDVNEYWIDEYLFADDPQLSKEDRERAPKRGGNGIMQTQRKGDILVARRDIILGKNVLDYQ